MITTYPELIASTRAMLVRLPRGLFLPGLKILLESSALREEAPAVHHVLTLGEVDLMCGLDEENVRRGLDEALTFLAGKHPRRAL